MTRTEAGKIIVRKEQITNSTNIQKTLTQDPTQPAAQAMYYAIGFKEEDFSKAQVGIVGMAGMATPAICTWMISLRKVRTVWMQQLVYSGCVFIPLVLVMASAWERMVCATVLSVVMWIADSIETNAGAQYYDAIIAIPVVIRTCRRRDGHGKTEPAIHHAVWRNHCTRSL